VSHAHILGVPVDFRAACLTRVWWVKKYRR
jgi:hypothetical protein